MTTEFVLLLAVYLFLVIGVMLGPEGPIATFNNSTPKLAALVERNLSTGYGFRKHHHGGGDQPWAWEKPE